MDKLIVITDRKKQQRICLAIVSSDLHCLEIVSSDLFRINPLEIVSNRSSREFSRDFSMKLAICGSIDWDAIGRKSKDKYLGFN
jgi:hypothetical protein